jgi:uncharacterized protein YdeI (YjbR/CyaY-like superfamily)
MVQREPSQSADTLANLPVVQFHRRKEWELWLKKNHAASTGVWLRVAKKSCSDPSVTYPEALDTALCYGWIDGQKRPDSERAWLQKFTPRGKKSIWSKINRDKAIALIESGEMQAAGLREIERAKGDGRWEAAYDSARTATVPADLQAALDRNPVARQFFKTLDGANRYAVLFRIQTAKKAETRARKIEQLVAMLERQEKIHP